MPSQPSGPPRAKPRPRLLLKRFVSTRRAIQIAVGVGLWLAVSKGVVSLWAVLVVGSVSSLVFGKFFCRWMCPMGAMMETMLGAGDQNGKQRSLYNYFKIGCPIAWFGGWFNRLSLSRVKVDSARCTDCNLCDKACYVSQLAPGHSLHAAGSVNASTHYSCSRCLSCVGACPTGALTYGWSLGTRNLLTGKSEAAPVPAGEAKDCASRP